MIKKGVKFFVSMMTIFWIGTVATIRVQAVGGEVIKNLAALEEINITECLEQEEDSYYLYFYRPMCTYCTEVVETILKLNNHDKVYRLDCDIVINRGKRYAWNSPIHEKKEIGYIDEKGNKVYYEGESEEKYLCSNEYNIYGHKKNYEISSTIPDGQDIEFIYVKMVTPEIDYSIIKCWDDIVIAGVPTLLHVQNGKIDKFYFGVEEINGIK